jgi:hypothetical protein
MRIRPQDCFSKNLPSLASGLFEGDRVSRPNFELPLSPSFVPVALIEGFSSRLPDFQHEAPAMYIEEVDLGAIRRARCGPDEPGCEADPRHLS